MPPRNERKRNREPSQTSSRAPSPSHSPPRSPPHSPHSPPHSPSSTLCPLINTQGEARPGVLTRQAPPGTSSILLQGGTAHPTPPAVHHLIDQATSSLSPHSLLPTSFLDHPLLHAHSSLLTSSTPIPSHTSSPHPPPTSSPPAPPFTLPLSADTQVVSYNAFYSNNEPTGVGEDHQALTSSVGASPPTDAGLSAGRQLTYACPPVSAAPTGAADPEGRCAHLIQYWSFHQAEGS